MLILPSERKTFKGGLVLALIYLALALGAITMVYPFAVMLTASVSSNYDYQRHSPWVKSLFSPSDRFLRTLAVYYKTFPRELYPDTPDSWTTWATVAQDQNGIDAFYRTLSSASGQGIGGAKSPEGGAARYSGEGAWRSSWADDAVCNYDQRDVPTFLREKYGTVEKLNAAWPVPHKSFYDVSFTLESKGNGVGQKQADFEEFKLWYLKRAAVCGDYICRTTPAHYTPELAAEYRARIWRQFEEHGWRDFFSNAFANYSLVSSYLFVRGRAFVNTIILVVLSVLASLTINPLAAYALSRFKLPATENILLFLLATMAFPAAVTAIPGFLLIRDLGLLNTFAALVLPTVASGMSIFILKGFFDALPRELYEAASIDGASEWTVFTRITLPMTTPILAVNALNSFIHAYSSWEWAFLVCQNESHWTLAVWMYQLSQTFAGQPWCVMAGFVLVSIPTALVFILCQKVILQGIVLPSMK